MVLLTCVIKTLFFFVFLTENFDSIVLVAEFLRSFDYRTFVAVKFFANLNFIY